jgi:hypothetical protein
VALITYINGRKYQEKLEETVQSLRTTLYKTDQKRKEVESQPYKAAYKNSVFSLERGSQSENYAISIELDASEIEDIVKFELLELNIKQGGNPLVPYEGQGPGFRITDTKFINDRWVLARFSDNYRWGDVLVGYTVDQNKKVSFETVKALLFDKKTD